MYTLVKLLYTAKVLAEGALDIIAVLNGDA